RGQSHLWKIAEQSEAYFDLGFNLKFIQQQFDNSTASGAGVDPGIMYYLSPKAHFGVTMQNFIEPKLNWAGETEIYQRTLRIGTAIHLYKFILSSDLLFLQDTFRWFTGLEFNIPVHKYTFALRSGINYKEITFGFWNKSRKYLN
ncbi:MAG: hypothetical protein QME68_08710, partial [Elusimicrobiota bacterium]|nr:hypothetical protein [Elusimicrobiota bacterium]